jgi:hypothetical protein
MKKTWCGLIFGCAVLLVADCSFMGSVADGSGTETTTGYTATAVYPDGSRAAGALVRIRTVDYFQRPDTVTTPGFRLDTLTDSLGRFHVKSIDTGCYTIEINDQERFAVAVRRVIQPSDSLTDLGTWTLKPYARCTGTIDSAMGAGDQVYVAVRGLERLAKAGAGGSFSISNMPEGMFRLHILGNGTGTIPHEVENVKLSSGGTISIAVPSGWQYSRIVYLNTSASGAGIQEDLFGFPVLFRLNDSNFIFEAAADSGRDILFTKADGTRYPYQMEYYNPQAKIAAFWVRVDTVFGNSDGQPVMISWGNPMAPDRASSSSVFDTANGFAAVLHFTRDCYDATLNGHHAANYGTVETTGIIGNCRLFHGTDSLRITGLLGSRSVLTISAWVRNSAVDTSGYEVFSIGRNVILRLDVKQTFSVTGLYHVHSADTQATTWSLIQAPSSQPNAWHYVCYSLDGINHVQTVSVDGDQAVVHQDTSTILYTGLGADTYIGSYAFWPNDANFIGEIDEVRVCKVVRSDAWRKLCYMNQKENDALVIMK